MGGSWEALLWAKTTRVGNHVDKLVLLMICEKANERFELYPSKQQLAHDCEMSSRRVGDHQKNLHDAGFITVIERVRKNGSQGRTTVVINHPDAPHMNGEPIVLDFQGHHLYPKDPDRLRTAGVQWISGGELNAVCPASKRAAKKTTEAAAQEWGDGSSSPDGGVTNRHPQGVTDRQGGGDESSSPEGDGSSPLIFPTGSSTNQPRTREDADAEADGWMDGLKDQKDKQDEPPNVRSIDDAKRLEMRRRRAQRLIEAIRTEHPEWNPSMDEAVARVVAAYAADQTDPQIRAALLVSFDGVHNVGAAITARLRNLPGAKRARRAPTKEPSAGRKRQDAADGAFLDKLRA